MSKVSWVRDFQRFLPLKNQFILSGNVRDFHIFEPEPRTIELSRLTTVLDAEFKNAGYALTLLFDQKNGFSVIGNRDPDIIQQLGLDLDSSQPVGLNELRQALDRIVSFDGPPIAFIIDYASRILIRKDILTDPEHRLFTEAFISSHTVNKRPYGEHMLPFFNTIVWIVENENDLPDWLVVKNPRIRSIPIPKPDRAIRSAIAPSLLKSMPICEHHTDEELKLAKEAFIDQTEGLLLHDMMSVIDLGKSENVEITKISDAVRRYKVGVKEDPWQIIDKSKIRNAQEFITNRVKGQDHAVTHLLDIIKRAITGVGTNKRSGRPRGVAFLAGPTGVGKTELAKTVTELLFGDSSAYIRFDMSEFNASHADQRLIGAPPGYLGHDSGGELTNAIRERPFSVVLFDEIEKAHPRILDKFLQILDDGVLTSGRGEQVYFSEALILFTSNLGINKEDDNGQLIANVHPSDPLESVQSKVSAEIEHHFKSQLNRPELLNRFGENIIIFDWIRNDIAVEILEHMIKETLSDVTYQDISIDISTSAKNQLSHICLEDLSNGGRGIRNQIEAHLVNPLARALFDHNVTAGSNCVISEIVIGKTSTDLKLEVQDNNND